jgi:diguanylate cyclase (GGDEF)-like protein
MSIAALLVATAAGVFASILWFRYTVHRPLDELARRATNAHDEWTDLARSDFAPGELSEIARSIAALHDELKRTRGEASYLRYSVDAQVDVKTRRVQQTLKQVEREATTDPLTLLENRRSIDEQLPALLAAARETLAELTLLLIDVDHFKALNDRLGHNAGDRVLASLGELIRASVRKGVDRPVRYGGDEFVIVMPGTSSVEAAAAARRLAALFAQRVRTLEVGEPPPALSIGIASLKEHEAQSPERLLRMADAAMYHAKRTRRGVCCIADVPPAARAAAHPAIARAVTPSA